MEEWDETCRANIDLFFHHRATESQRKIRQNSLVFFCDSALCGEKITLH